MQMHQIVTSIYTGIFIVSIVFPLWWITTRSYRAALPNYEITKLQETHITIAADVPIIIDPAFNANAEKISKLENAINDGFESRIVLCKHVKISAHLQKLSETEFSKIKEKLQNDKQDCLIGKKLESETGIYPMIMIKSDDRHSDVEQLEFYPEIGVIAITSDISTTDVLKDVVDLVLATHFSSLCQLGNSNLEKTDYPVINANFYNVSERITPNAQIISFTLAIADPHSMDVKWDADEMLEIYLEPYLKSIKQLVDLKVQSQVQYFADFELTKKTSGNGYIVTKDFLPLMINPLESRFNNYVSKSQILHYVLFVPSPKDSPLSVEGSEDRFMVEGWGGLWIYQHNTSLNQDNLSKRKEVFINSKDVVGRFLPMIDRHYGFRSRPDLASCDDMFKIPQYIITNRAAASAVNLFNSTLNTIVSLSRLMNNIENMVIRDDIRDLIVKSIEHLKQGQAYLQKGDIIRGLNHIKDANILSEKAFYDPSLLALLYFPSEEKYAIYIPLFLPIALPIAVSLYKTLKFCFSSTKE